MGGWFSADITIYYIGGGGWVGGSGPILLFITFSGGGGGGGWVGRSGPILLIITFGGVVGWSGPAAGGNFWGIWKCFLKKKHVPRCIVNVFSA